MFLDGLYNTQILSIKYPCSLKKMLMIKNRRLEKKLILINNKRNNLEQGKKNLEGKKVKEI
jgi:hypothetical protein